MSTINVDPEKQDDAFYRYKMPSILAKGEGHGNGVKTVLVNLDHIAERISRKEEYMLKYIHSSLSVSAEYKDGKYILKGSIQTHTPERIQAAIFDFITKFVLCKACRNPETVLQVDDSKKIWLNCKACSRVTPADDRDEKIVRLIVKNEGPLIAKKKGGKKTKQTISKTEKEEKEFDQSTRQAGETDDIEDIEKTEERNPIDVLREFLDANSDENDIVAKVLDIKQDYGLSDRNVVQLVFESCFRGKLPQDIHDRAKLMRRFLKNETEKELIVSLEMVCNDTEEYTPKFPIFLKKFYDEDVISESVILQWFESNPVKGMSKDAQRSFREKSKPFIEWLKQADDSDEEEEEDDD